MRQRYGERKYKYPREFPGFLPGISLGIYQGIPWIFTFEYDFFYKKLELSFFRVNFVTPKICLIVIFLSKNNLTVSP